jgi:hypothetical protein
MLKSATNPGGLPIEVLDQHRSSGIHQLVTCATRRETDRS